MAGKREVDCPSLGAKAGEDINIGDAFESFGEWSLAFHPFYLRLMS